MRIAVSGTHSVGKTTFISDFIRAYPHYSLEVEPFRKLNQLYDLSSDKKQTRFSNGLQFYYNLSRIKHYHSNENCVIFDRCPIDYIPYSLYAEYYHESDINHNFVESLIDPIKESLNFIDLILYISINPKYLVDIEKDGIRSIDPIYRTQVDEYFKQIYFSNLYGFISEKNSPKIIEIYGNREERLKQFADIIK